MRYITSYREEIVLQNKKYLYIYTYTNNNYKYIQIEVKKINAEQTVYPTIKRFQLKGSLLSRRSLDAYLTDDISGRIENNNSPTGRVWQRQQQITVRLCYVEIVCLGVSFIKQY